MRGVRRAGDARCIGRPARGERRRLIDKSAGHVRRQNRPSPRRTGAATGFTLIEVLIALAIVRAIDACSRISSISVSAADIAMKAAADSACNTFARACMTRW
ncbi:prepilin-type N-terminal cleavage/methylation domain-containing protein [Burkholderia sp. AU19243]|uniref:prepilin-type N-terminal cleavage/methylation domain-containing protein n=1 Tax=Burkholderia sp. AU19243 TaxID=2824810 RepID=UPI002011D8FE|nr:prepilin-type N-terminal cleavage/methylation domain-containing protein [Burkholderia sp. AU19243]